MAQVINLDRDSVFLQVFSGTMGLGNDVSVRFPGHPMRRVVATEMIRTDVMLLTRCCR